MTREFQTPIVGGADACPRCRIEIATALQVPVGSLICPHCATELCFVRVLVSTFSAWFFDAEDVPKPLTKELCRIRVNSGTFNGLEGYVLCQGTTTDEVIIALEIFGRPAPITLQRVFIEDV